MTMTFNVLDIIRGTTVDGPGFRTAIYLAGCAHKCSGCHNPQSHDPKAGTVMTLEEILMVVRQEDFNVTLTGGDPLYHIDAACALAKAIKNCGYNIWLYTGFTWNEIISSSVLSQILHHVDVIVDGPFIECLRNTDLLFRGSSNQRLIQVAASLQAGAIVEYG